MNDAREIQILGKISLYKLELDLVIFLQKSPQKSLEKLQKRVLKKLVNLLEKKSLPRKKKAKPPETRAEEIMSIMKEEGIAKVDNFQYVEDVYNDLL